MQRGQRFQLRSNVPGAGLSSPTQERRGAQSFPDAVHPALFHVLEIASVYHDIHCVEGCQVRTLLEDVAEDLLPDGLSSLFSSLIGEKNMNTKTCRGITNL